ncbi:MAG: CstA-like transporter-associated (seleno)protein [Enterobacterales bacterium endosymbiont of Blomia tropicalis]|uniref:YbdD/YjiX family protein n=1 Tax=Mixta mediterraneensis TaxID=2758443 RepID=UPI0025A6D4F1|nr:CstA-like transporter-associated (seleno)protein [Mixta mediterraneensis]MDL4912403.1 CstA-like transporter-associated (seleno)protein [Mixta mediterraneensis]
MSDAVHRALRPQGVWRIERCLMLSAPAATCFSWRGLWRGLQQSFRLMVGVQDYQKYLQHMRCHHANQTPMTEREFHRYCLDARFPSQAGKLGKCPC